jgi:hypothetical protein
VGYVVLIPKVYSQGVVVVTNISRSVLSYFGTFFLDISQMVLRQSFGLSFGLFISAKGDCI